MLAQAYQEELNQNTHLDSKAERYEAAEEHLAPMVESLRTDGATFFVDANRIFLTKNGIGNGAILDNAAVEGPIKTIALRRLLAIQEFDILSLCVVIEEPKVSTPHNGITYGDQAYIAARAIRYFIRTDKML